MKLSAPSVIARSRQMCVACTAGEPFIAAGLTNHVTLGRPGQESSGLIVGPRRYLFSGLLKCAECGGSITLVSGRGRNGADRYGCSLEGIQFVPIRCSFGEMNSKRVC